MAVYYTSKAQPNGGGVTVGYGGHRAPVVLEAIVHMSTAMLDNANDDVGLFYAPPGFICVGAAIGATDMDTGGSPALAIDVGDASDEDRIFAASNVGQAGTYSSALARTGFLHKYTTRTEIRAYIQTAAATAAAGTLYVALWGFVDPDYSTTPLVAYTA